MHVHEVSSSRIQSGEITPRIQPRKILEVEEIKKALTVPSHALYIAFAQDIPKMQTALGLYGTYRLENSLEARFLQLITILEILKIPTEHEAVSLNLIKKWKKEVRATQPETKEQAESLKALEDKLESLKSFSRVNNQIGKLMEQIGKLLSIQMYQVLCAVPNSFTTAGAN